ncbi:hypothetical protein A1F94_009531 [Pyrenophora tritici-repentis]|nr:hypothetical protein A1F94_009531 [Pyrenophora tritici-repentis]
MGPCRVQGRKFDERSEAYQRQQNAHLAAIDEQAQQPLQQTQPLEPLQPQPQRPSQGEHLDKQGQAMQPQQWYPQTQTRPATAYREVTPSLSNLQNRVPDRPLAYHMTRTRRYRRDGLATIA